MLGSTAPLRVAITRPSSGVKPIDVSTQTPSRTADAEQPAPRWQTITRNPCGSRPSILAARSEQ